MRIEKKDRAKALMGLYNRTMIVAPMAMVTGVYTVGSMTLDEAENVIRDRKGDLYFDYLFGRLLKVDLRTEEVDFRLYDRDNGEGAGELAVLEELTKP